MEREKIIEKIKKLREHSVENGCNEAEAIQFALKASNNDSISRGMQQGRDAVRSRRVEAPRGNLLPA